MSSEYFAKWYVANKEKLAAKRRERYRNDPAYKEKVLLNSKRSRKKSDTDGAGAGRVVGADGVERNGYTVAEASFMLGVSRETLVAWNRTGTIPVSPFVSKRSYYYTAGQIEGIKKAIEAFKNGEKRVHVRKGNAAFTNMVAEHWNSLPETKQA